MQRELGRLTKDEPGFGLERRAFLGRSYNLKAIADYETGFGVTVTTAQATEAIAAGQSFVAAIVGLLPATPAPPS